MNKRRGKRHRKRRGFGLETSESSYTIRLKLDKEACIGMPQHLAPARLPNAISLQESSLPNRERDATYKLCKAQW